VSEIAASGLPLEVLGPAILAALAALSVMALVLTVDQLRLRRRAAGRLARFGLTETPIAAAPAPSLVRRLGALLAARTPRADLRRLHEQLLRAGLGDRLSADDFLGLRLLGAAAGGLLGALLGGALAPLLGGGWPATLALLPAGAALGGGLGMLVPPLVLARLAQRRRALIERQLPNVVDVLAVSLEAGLSFDSVVAFICERSETPLALELRRYLADLRLGRSRREALLALVERTQSEGLRELAAAVIQADELGTGLARALRGQATALRTAQRIRAEEHGRQAPVKLIFPIVLCILPVLFIVIIGPALLQALALFGE
jgi:tight adherence protein C